MFRDTIKYRILDFPIQEGRVEQATLEGKYLLTRSGKMVWVTLILNIKPIPFARELLGLFCKLFEEEYYVEIHGLYDRFEGNISIFRRNLANQKNIDEIVEEIFHINLSLPHKINNPKGKKLSSKLKKIYHFAKETANKTKGLILLQDLFNDAINSLNMSNDEIASSLYNLVLNEFLIPIESEKKKI